MRFPEFTILERIVIVAATAALLVLSIASAAFPMTADEARTIALAHGLPDTTTVEVDRTVDDPNGTIWIFADGAHIVLDQPEWMSDAWTAVILYHELAHYWQRRDDEEFEIQRDREWSADRDGIVAQCKTGMLRNPVEDFADLWSWVVAHQGVGTSVDHGNRFDRAVSLIGARLCDRPSQAL